ncbi:hypothetical protein PAEPH01_2650 [Pancytospora epiphaga]|nr:hypothetical protein PAEPH01_2650 [Pancytospora epiphaga]
MVAVCWDIKKFMYDLKEKIFILITSHKAFKKIRKNAI